MKVITICGSLKFKKEMMFAAEKLALEGNCVLTPTYKVIEGEISDKQLSLLKQEHFKRIEMSDAILVLNKGNYIGKSTETEIKFAKSLHKEVIYYTELLNGS